MKAMAKLVNPTRTPIPIPTPRHGRLRWITLKSVVRGNLLTILTVSGVIAGIVVGYIMKASRDPGGWDKRSISYVTFLGDLFLSMLNGLVLPLIVTSIIAAIASLDLRMSTKIGERGIAFFLGTTILAVVLGLFLALTIQPGVRIVTTPSGEVRRQSLAPLKDKENEPSLVQDNLMDLIRSMFPPNLVQASFEHYKTKLTLPDYAKNQTRVKIPLEEYEMTESYERGTNLMGILVISIAIGIAVAKLGERGEPVLKFFQSLSDAMTIVTGWVIRFSPIGVTSLIAGEMLKAHDVFDVATSLGLYLMTIMIGHFIHGFILLPLIFFIMTWRQPFTYVVNMAPAFFTAIGTGSSSATLPVTIKCVEEKNDVDPRISRFLLPIGATINMDGTALFQAVAAVFIAQLVGMQLTIGKIVVIIVMATAASAAAAGIPQGGFITLVMVISTMGLPGKFISYVLPIDWLIDRSRTAINVLGDSIAAGVVQEMCMEELYTLPLTLPPVAISPSTVREEDTADNENDRDVQGDRDRDVQRDRDRDREEANVNASIHTPPPTPTEIVPARDTKVQVNGRSTFTSFRYI